MQVLGSNFKLKAHDISGSWDQPWTSKKYPFFAPFLHWVIFLDRLYQKIDSTNKGISILLVISTHEVGIKNVM